MKTSQQARGLQGEESTWHGSDVADRLKNPALSLRMSCRAPGHLLTQAPFHLVGTNKAQGVDTYALPPFTQTLGWIQITKKLTTIKRIYFE